MIKFDLIALLTAPTAAPSNLRATSILSNSITFGWDALSSSEAKGIIRWYEISCADGTGNNYTVSYSDMRKLSIKGQCIYQKLAWFSFINSSFPYTGLDIG